MARAADVTISRIRRPFKEGEVVVVDGQKYTAVLPEPAEILTPPRPFGDLTAAPDSTILEVSRQLWPERSATVHNLRQRGLDLILCHLLGFAGSTWQERWVSANLNERSAITQLVRSAENGTKQQRLDMVTGIRTLFCLRIVTPSLPAFRSITFQRYPELFRAVQRDPLLDKALDTIMAREHVPRNHRMHAQFDICCALTTQGAAIEDLTPGAMLHYAVENAHYGLAIGQTARDKNRHSGYLAWEVLRESGHFPPDTPPTLRGCLMGRRPTIVQMVDSHGVHDPDIRQLFIDYLTRRQPFIGYSFLTNLTRSLVGYFWAGIQDINPGQAAFEIDQATYDQWRESINWTKPRKGQPPRPRKDPHTILIFIRAFYADLHSWAVEDPATWGRWAARCPIPPRELHGYNKRRRRLKERIDDRIRLRQPLLPALVEYVETTYERARALTAAGAAVEGDARFRHDGRHYERVVTVHDLLSPDHIAVRLRDLDTGEIINATADETYHFWRWAAVEVLRLSGIRIEELCELTHLSIRQYQRPNGEIIALLVIAPSKSDRERVIPMSAELFHVIAQIIRRHTASGRPIPVVHRYDSNDKEWTEPLPFLFQRQTGALPQVLSRATIQTWIKDACAELGRTNSAFADLHFTPHDFRRLLATELVNSGLPIHIGAALLGHLDIQTTRGYVTVFDEDVVRHYQTFLNRRREMRPDEEYVAVTDQEWDDFQEHFDKRKIELGGCARPYGSSCQHEFACIRCPMLNINPKMLPRLQEIEQDLLERRQRAEQEAWLGEIEGIDLTLSYLRQKREQTERLTRLAPGGPTMLTLEPPRPRPNKSRPERVSSELGFE